jgi:hypothetical protein
MCHSDGQLLKGREAAYKTDKLANDAEFDII